MSLKSKEKVQQPPTINQKTGAQSSMNLLTQKNDKLFLNAEALKKIENLVGEIALCVCVGSYRSGKSFILSHLVDKLNPKINRDLNCTFEVDHGQDGFTKGCWINTDIFQVKIDGEMVNLIFIDTEGIESSNTLENWDTKLFLFSLLVSSLFIYNSKSTLSADMFKKLAVMTNIQSKIEFNSDESIEKPIYLSLVRDFALKPQYTPQEDIDRFLKLDLNPDADEQITKKNNIRKNMINSFESLKCFRLPPPALKLDMLQNLENEKFENLTTEFQEAFADMCKLVKNLLKPKCIDGKALNGYRLAKYMNAIVQLINTDKAVNLHDTMLSVCDMEQKYYNAEYLKILKEFEQKISKEKDSNKRQDLLEKSCKSLTGIVKTNILHEYLDNINLIYYKTEMDLYALKFPVKDRDLKAKSEEISMIYRSTIKPIEEQYKEHTFTKESEKKLSELAVVNREKLTNHHKKLMQNLWDLKFENKYKYLENVESLSTSGLEKDWQTLVSDFKMKQLDEVDQSFWNAFKKEINFENIAPRIQQQKDKIQLEKDRKKLEEDRLLQIENQKKQQEAQRLLQLENERILQSQISSNQYRASNNYYCPPSPPVRYQESVASSSSSVGSYMSRGSANNREVFSGPRGGLYYVNDSGNKQYVKKSSVNYDYDY